MKEQHLALWRKIAEFKLNDSDATRPFSQKLQEENNWTPEKTARVIVEYKKFIFLCATNPNGASPSPTVDIAWHLHLTYTENYWEGLCNGILKTPLHHKPSKGGNSEQQKHNDWYRQTLVAYAQNFGHVPPDDIWELPFFFYPAQYLPPESPFLIPKRAENEVNFEENTEGVHDLVREQFEAEEMDSSDPIYLYSAYVLVAFLAVALLFPSHLKGILFLLPLAALGFLVCKLISDEGIRLSDLYQKQVAKLPRNLSPYMGAWILGGNERLTTTLIYEVADQLDFDKTINAVNLTLKKEPRNRLNPLYMALQTVESNGQTKTVSTIFIRETIKVHAEQIKQEVNQQGYKNEPMAQTVKVLVWAFFLIGFIRLLEGGNFGNPVGFLIATLVLFSFGMATAYYYRPIGFEGWRENFNLKYRDFKQNDLWLFAFGTLVLPTHINLYAMENYLKPRDESSGGDGGGSSCGGDGGGDGGGGCGGCGGCGS